MKWFSQILVMVYAFSALYFLYMAAMGIFIYFANKSLGHNESFSIPGRNLLLGLVLGGIAFIGYRWLKDPVTYKTGMMVVYLPLIIPAVFLAWFVIMLIFSNGRWN